jgi:hypothetical protein
LLTGQAVRLPGDGERQGDEKGGHKFHILPVTVCCQYSFPLKSTSDLKTLIEGRQCRAAYTARRVDNTLGTVIARRRLARSDGPCRVGTQARAGNGGSTPPNTAATWPLHRRNIRKLAEILPDYVAPVTLSGQLGNRPNKPALSQAVSGSQAFPQARSCAAATDPAQTQLGFGRSAGAAAFPSRRGRLLVLARHPAAPESRIGKSGPAEPAARSFTPWDAAAARTITGA